MVVAVCDEKARSSLSEFWEHGKLVGIGRGYRDASDHPRPANPHVHPKAVEGLPEQGVLAESGLPAESTATVGSGEQARRQRERVRQSEGRVVGSEGEKLLPEVLLDLEEVGRLPSEGGAVDDPERGEPLCVVPSEEEADCLVVGVYAEELSYDLDGEDLGVGKLRGGTTLTDTPSFEPIVYQAEDGDDEGALRSTREDLLYAGWFGRYRA